MKKAPFISSSFKLLLFCLLLSNFSAFSQKTTIWIVSYAETDDSTATNKQPALNNTGQIRAQDLVKALKHENIKVIYVTPQKASALTAAPLAQKDKILPKISADSVHGLVKKILTNYQGTNLLLVVPYYTVIPYVQAFGGMPPFDSITNNDHDLLFSVELHNDKTELFISHYGKPHHTTEIPQQYILDNFYSGYVPTITNH